ncbi:hypothetical protein VNI00_007859 [Paramarasmius palmivorus]|uniref:Amino acid permease/ SLC12A domain-containing protein n=1 Tax=Paramarasmius palmivorus TaxID=297713 RepID=A0AAW0CVD0_9AGAR
MSSLHEKDVKVEEQPVLRELSPSSPDELLVQERHHGKLVRELKNRHVAMISIGGVIGTGLFLGSSTALRNGGPVGLLLGYIVVGSICWSMMISLGEMVSYLPIPGGHIALAERFFDPALSFAMGWNYCYNLVIGTPAELSAAAVLVEYWTKSNQLNPLWISICTVVIVGINLLGAVTERNARSIKVITIVGLIILGIVLDLGGGPNHDRIGFRYWLDPGPFVQFNGISGAEGRFLAWWAVMTQAVFSFLGVEMVAIAAGETKNPRRNVPRAIKRVYIRILLFYIGGTFVIGLLVPSNEPKLNLGDTGASPFVIAIQNAGIRGLPSVINAALITSAWSAASSGLYTASRALYGLAATGNAPSVFLRTTSKGLPLVSVVVCSMFCGLAFMVVSNGAGTVFGWLQALTAIGGLLNWFGISITYIRFHAGMVAQGFDRSKLPYRFSFQPYAAWYACIGCLLMAFLSGWKVFLKDQWDTGTFITNYLPVACYPILFVGCKLWRKTRFVRASEMDLISRVEEIEKDW